MNAQLRAATPHDAPANAPDWLADELSANPAFVREAIENDDGMVDAMARAWLRGASIGRHEVTEAVHDWIDHQWAFHKADAVKISNVWQVRS